MATKTAEKVAGLTVETVTGVTARPETGLTPNADRALTPGHVTTRRYKKRARKCACGCGETVVPTALAPNKVYFNDACRQRDHRRKTARLRPPKAAPALELTPCQYCGGTFLAEVGKGAKYCKPAHRVAAAEYRKTAAIDAVFAIAGGSGGITIDDVINMVELDGMKQVSTYLRQNGLVYDESGRAWVIAVQPGDVFAQMKG